MNDAPPPLPRKSNKTALYVILAVVGVGLLALLGIGVVKVVQKVTLQQQKQKTAIQELDAFQKENQSHMRDIVAGEDSVAGSAEALEAAQKKLGSIADKLSPTDRIVVQAAQDVMKEVQPRLKEYQDAYTELQAQNSFSAAGIKIKDDIEKRRVVVQKFADANQKLTAVYVVMGDHFKKQMQTRGATSNASEAATKGFLRSAHVDVVAEIREDDRQLGVKMFEILDFYKERWGEWTMSADGQMTFQEDADVDRYNQLMADVQKIADHQAIAQRKMLINK